MDDRTPTRCTAFAGVDLVASGELRDVVAAAKAVVDRGVHAPVLIFDDTTCRVIEVDFRGTVEDVLGRSAEPACAQTSAAAEEPQGEARRGPGRPKLGVVAREVTLLPRHWEWLASQPGGASVALRKLVEEARRTHRDADRARQAQEAAYRFLTTMAGDLPGYEEATRALYAGDAARFAELVEPWPADVRDHAKRLAEPVFPTPPSPVTP